MFFFGHFSKSSNDKKNVEKVKANKFQFNCVAQKSNDDMKEGAGVTGVLKGAEARQYTGCS